MPRFLLLALLMLLAALRGAGAAEAMLSEAELRRLMPPGYVLGAREADIPAWPLLRDGTIAGYIFESNALVTIPGFTGTPIDLLIALDRDGRFVDIGVLDQNEPVFVDGLGIEPFVEFLRQYRSRSIRQNIKVGSVYGSGERDTSTSATLDGIAKATASVRIANVTILASSLKVARAKMADVAPREAAAVREDVRDVRGWESLVAEGLVGRLRLANRDVEAAFADTPFAGEDAEAAAPDAPAPDAPFADLAYAELDVPSVGISLLGEDGYARLRAKLEPWEHAVLVMGSGRWSFLGDGFVRGTVPDRLALRQGAFPVSLRDADIDLAFAPGVPRPQEAAVFRIDGRTGFDPSQPWTLTLRVTRTRGYFLPETESRDFTAAYALPARLFAWPEPLAGDGAGSWRAAWSGRAGELAVLGLGLAVLAVALARPAAVTRRPRVFAWMRWGYLAFTLLFVGWWAQAQLSIVNVLALVKAVLAGRDLSFFLYDPPTLVVWGFTLGTLVLWGRGAFCGWLCPFGALQEMAAGLGRRLGVPRLALSPRVERRLSALKYVLLAGVIGGTVADATLAETLAEIEPFKTAITLDFMREAPFVLYAAATVLASMLVFKGFCRFVCPLGAALAILGRLRRLDWIPRRAECGTPCQLCRARCAYGAIGRDGAVRYDACFQCLDCVAIYHDGARCVPRVLARKRRTADGA